MTAERIDAWVIDIPLAAQLTLGRMTIRDRGYSVVRVVASDGTEGLAYGLSRNAPIDLIVRDLVAPAVVGHSVEDVSGVHDRARVATLAIGASALISRAASLVDIALWDIRARRAGVPLWQLLGGRQVDVPVLLVEGYPRRGEGVGEFADRLSDRVRGGATWLKLANSPADMADRLRAVRDRIGYDCSMVVDVAWAWDDVELAARTIEQWSQARLAWVEDPAPASDLDFYRGLAASRATAIGAGDEVSEQWRLLALLEEGLVDVLRLDATTCGGITGFVKVLRRANELGVPVSSHIYPEIHRHLVALMNEPTPVEWYGPTGEFDKSNEFVALADGGLGVDRCLAPSAHGIGMEFDWDFVEHHCRRR